MICASSEGPQGGTSSGYRPGRVLLEKYELVRPLAEGGMGVVWVAHNHVLDLDVAIKLTLSGSAVSSDASRQRALSEARLAAQLAHPAVCRVLDFGLTEEGDPCVVTELLKGETLDSVLALEGRMSPVEAVQVILPILDALSASHEKGIVHRDVKPSNVYLARDSGNRVQPKLLDFGIAQGQNEAMDWAVSGTVSGTPCYMSPEQACGAGSVDARTDIWSACATLYELLTGEPPFDGESCTELLVSVVQSSPASLPPDTAVDPWLSAILMRGLEKDPKDRWASAAELFAELSHWLLSRGVESDVCGHSLRALLKERGIGLRSVYGPDEVRGSTTLKSPGSGAKPSVRVSRPLTWKRALWFTTRGLPVAVAGIFALLAIRAYTPERTTLTESSIQTAAQVGGGRGPSAFEGGCARREGGR